MRLKTLSGLTAAAVTFTMLSAFGQVPEMPLSPLQEATETVLMEEVTLLRDAERNALYWKRRADELEARLTKAQADVKEGITKLAQADERAKSQQTQIDANAALIAKLQAQGAPP